MIKVSFESLIIIILLIIYYLHLIRSLIFFERAETVSLLVKGH